MVIIKKILRIKNCKENLKSPDTMAFTMEESKNIQENINAKLKINIPVYHVSIQEF